jgi:hypothetical protein
MGAGQSLVKRSRRSFSALKDLRLEREVAVTILSAGCARGGQLSSVAQDNAQVGFVWRYDACHGQKAGNMAMTNAEQDSQEDGHLQQR